MSTVYLFHRAQGFYPLELGSDLEAVANAHANPGTVKVTDTNDRTVFTNAGAAAIDDATVDSYVDLVLRASGSALRHYSLEKPRADMRAAVRAAIDAGFLCVGGAE